MKFSSLTSRIAPESSGAWAIHTRARQLKESGTPVIMLSIGEPDFSTPKIIVNSAIRSLKAGRTHYLPSAGSESLRQAIAQHHQNSTGQATTADNVIIVPGAQCGLFVSAICLLETGDSVIVPEPTYVTYEGVVGATGAKITPVPLRPENHFHLDTAELATLITSNTRVILLNTPHNPTGAVMRRDTINSIVQIALEHDLWIISDEVYSDLTFDREHTSPSSVSRLYNRAVTISSFSKSFAMTGWRIGWVIAPNSLVQHIDRLLESMLFGTPPFIQDAAETALSHGAFHVGEMCAAYKRRRDLALSLLQDHPKLKCHKPEGGMYLMIDVRAMGCDGITFANSLLDREHISVLPGEGFGQSAAGFIRMSLSASDTDIRIACERLAKFSVY